MEKKKRIYGGVITEELDPLDFVAGSSSPIKLEQRNTTHDWLLFFGDGERQSLSWGDTQGCVSFSSVHHLVATQLNWMLVNNLLPKPALEFFSGKNSLGISYIFNGRFDLSERFIVVLSGTTEQGNTARNVLQAIRKCGIVPEAACPNAKPQTREEYFAISEEAKALGIDSLRYLTFFWQAIPKEDINRYLVQAPVMNFSPVCPGWESDAVVKKCELPVAHATATYAVDFVSGDFKIYDSYTPFQKVLAADYPIKFAYQLVVYPIPQEEQSERYYFSRNINPDLKVPGERSTDVLMLQRRLNVQPTGVYDDQTRAAVLNMQLKELPARGLASIFELLWLWGRSVGPKTRKFLNQ